MKLKSGSTILLIANLCRVLYALAIRPPLYASFNINIFTTFTTFITEANPSRSISKHEPKTSHNHHPSNPHLFLMRNS
jgi:hypothetical protein